MNFENILPKNGPTIEEVKKYIDKYKEDVIVLKIGGSVLLNKILFDQLIEDISILKKIGLNIVTIHGGSKNIKEKLDKAKIESNFIDGLRVTDQKTVKIVEEALLEINNNIIEKLKDKNCEGIEFSPSKNNIIFVNSINDELMYVGNPKEIRSDQMLEEVKKK